MHEPVAERAGRTGSERNGPGARHGPGPPTSLAGLTTSGPTDVREREASEVERRLAHSGALSPPLPRRPADGGAPLDPLTRSVFERHLNHDLGAVRIHTGETASARAASVGARALTLGTDVMFGAGQYRPDTLAGRRLLAHELVHAARHSTARPARTVLRSPLVSVEEIGPVPGPEAEPRGQAVGRYARVGEVTPHLTLRSAMDPRSIGLLPDPLYVDALHLNDRVFVLEEFRDDWVKVRTDDGQLGYVSKVYLFIGAPDPDARLYRIREGDTALGIAQQFYDCGEWGTDGRFYVNVLVAVNEASEGRGSGKKGIYKAGNRSEKDVASWKDTRLLADYWIWVPGKAFARSLAGTVSSGSVTYELWQSVKGVVGLVLGILDGIATTLVSLVTDIVDLISMIVDTVVDIAKKGLVAKLRELRAFVEGLDPAQIASALWSGFTTRWNAEDSYDRWKFRGVVIGTVLAEIALAALSGGASVALRVAGKVGKVAKLAAKLGKLDSVADFARKVDRAADATDAGRRVRKALKGREAPDTPRAAHKPSTNRRDTPERSSSEPEPRPQRGAPETTSTRTAWDDPHLTDDQAYAVYKDAGVRTPLSEADARRRIQDGWRFDPERRRWRKPNKPRKRAPRAPTGPFLRDALRKVSNPAHPLHKLVVRHVGADGTITFDWRKTTLETTSGKTQTGRYPGNEEGVVVQVGHVESYAGGGPQRYMLEDAEWNKPFGGDIIESKGGFSQKVAVEVDGVWVDLTSLQQWERLDVVPQGTVAAARQ